MIRRIGPAKTPKREQHVKAEERVSLFEQEPFLGAEGGIGDGPGRLWGW